jgi:hypothetical protein
MLYAFHLFYTRAKAREPLSIRLHLGLILALFAGAMSHGTMLAAAVCLLVFLAAWAAWNKRADVLRSSVFVALGVAMLIAPWTWRNYRVTGLFIPVAGNAGLAYFAGNAHWGITEPAGGPSEPRYAADLRHAGLPTNAPAELVQFYGFTSPDWEKIANARMKEHLRAHPGAFARKFCLNALEYYFPVIYRLIPPAGTLWSGLPLKQRFADHRSFRDVVLSLHSLVLLALATGGCVALWRIRGLRFVTAGLVLAWAAYALPYFPFLCFVGNQPYTFGTFPVLAILSAAFLLRRNPAARP